VIIKIFVKQLIGINNGHNLICQNKNKNQILY